MHSNQPLHPRAIANHDFDYIICGGGTSGCVIASKLASVAKVSVLLVEAGRDSGLVPDVLVPGCYVKQLKEDHDGLWKLETTKQKHLYNRRLMFLRGKQMGGSSAVNYMALARGPAVDYDEWATLTGDDEWKWENILPLMKDLEDFDPRLPDGMRGFADPQPSCHGGSGPLKIGFGDEMVPGVKTFFEACIETGIPLCPDNNSGNPVGVGLAQFNVRHGERSYAANAFLDAPTRNSLKNLTIMTETDCDKIHTTNGVVTGVDLYHRPRAQTVHVQCRNEVIVCAGTFGSVKILNLSGIGPRNVLEKHNIPVVKDLSGCGQNMLDHSIITCEYKVDKKIPAHNQIFLQPELLKEAEAQYTQNRTGPLAMYGSSGTVAFPRIQKIFESDEFANLDQRTRDFLLEPTRPSAEIWLGSGPSMCSGGENPQESYMTHELLLQNNLSRGTVTIGSRDPRQSPVINPNFLDHPFDRRIAIESIRTALKISRTTAYKGTIEKMVHGPKFDFMSTSPDTISDEVMLDFIRNNLDQGYHSLGTCKMGKATDPEAVVDTQFRIMGMRNLRVADLSVCPILTCNHTQVNAYLIGMRCAQKVIQCHKENMQHKTKL